MNIRQAISTDSLCLSALCVDVQNLHVEAHPDIFKKPQGEELAAACFDEMLADLTTRVFIAEENGQALGYLLCKLIEREENPFTFAMRYLLIGQISVRPQARGQRVGAALMKQAETCARELNVSRIQLDSWGFNTEAHAFFEKRGFKKFKHHFWRDV